MALVSSTVEILAECLGSSIELARKVKFDADDIRHTYPVALYSSILELIDECIYLVREGPKPGIPILSRAILETFVNLKNATSDEAYTGYVEYEWLKSWLSLMEQAKAGNAYLGAIADFDDLQQRLDEHQARLEELREMGIKKLSILEKFQMAEMEEEYRTIYGFMSAHSHGSLQSLIDKHIDVSSGRPQINAFVDRPIEKFDSYLGTTCEIFMMATELFHAYFESEFAEAVGELRAKVEDYKASITSD